MRRTRAAAFAAGIAVTALAAVTAPATSAWAVPAPTVSQAAFSVAAVSTASVPTFPSSMVLKVGSTGSQVKAVQRALTKRGYKIGAYTLGVYNQRTANAVSRFKAARSTVYPAGPNRYKVGPATYRDITSVLRSAPSTSAPSSSPTYRSVDQCYGLPDSTRRSLSDSQRAAVTLSSFVRSRMGCKVVVRESTGSCTVASSGGTYMGKWQLDMWEWNRFGGTAYASRPNAATCAEQDVIAYRNWRERGWSPWTTAY